MISAGAWLPTLLPQSMSAAFAVRRQLLCWFRVDDKQPLERYRPEAFPVFIWQTPRKQTIYGFPWVGTDGAGDQERDRAIRDDDDRR